MGDTGLLGGQFPAAMGPRNNFPGAGAELPTSLMTPCGGTHIRIPPPSLSQTKHGKQLESQAEEQQRTQNRGIRLANSCPGNPKGREQEWSQAAQGTWGLTAGLHDPSSLKTSPHFWAGRLDTTKKVQRRCTARCRHPSTAESPPRATCGDAHWLLQTLLG